MWAASGDVEVYVVLLLLFSLCASTLRSTNTWKFKCVHFRYGCLLCNMTTFVPLSSGSFFSRGNWHTSEFRQLWDMCHFLFLTLMNHSTLVFFWEFWLSNLLLTDEWASWNKNPVFSSHLPVTCRLNNDLVQLVWNWKIWIEMFL